MTEISDSDSDTDSDIDDDSSVAPVALVAPVDSDLVKEYLEKHTTLAYRHAFNTDIPEPQKPFELEKQDLEMFLGRESRSVMRLMLKHPYFYAREIAIMNETGLCRMGSILDRKALTFNTIERVKKLSLLAARRKSPERKALKKQWNQEKRQIPLDLLMADSKDEKLIPLDLKWYIDHIDSFRNSLGKRDQRIAYEKRIQEIARKNNMPARKALDEARLDDTNFFRYTEEAYNYFSQVNKTTQLIQEDQERSPGNFTGDTPNESESYLIDSILIGILDELSKVRNGHLRMQTAKYVEAFISSQSERVSQVAEFVLNADAPKDLDEKKDHFLNSPSDRVSQAAEFVLNADAPKDLDEKEDHFSHNF